MKTPTKEGAIMTKHSDVCPVHLGTWRASGLTNRQIQTPLCDVNDDGVSGELTDVLAKVTCENCKADHAHVRRPTCYGYEKCEHNGYCDDPCHYDVDRIVAELRAALSEACDLAEEANGDPSSCSHNIPIGDRIVDLRKLATCPSEEGSDQ
jgi:hypothetical protein